MTTKKLEKIRQQLLEEKRQLVTELIQDNNDIADLSEDEIGDDVDAAFKSYEKELLYGMSRHQEERLEQINAALERFERDTFGQCISCGATIDPERLEFMPYALKCINCKTEEEDPHRQAKLEDQAKNGGE